MNAPGVRLLGPLPHRLLRVLAGALVVAAVGTASAAAEEPRGGRFDRPLGPPHGRGHGPAQVCSGTPEAPGVLAGVIAGNVRVEGACVVNAGQAVVFGNLTVTPGSALVAAFALDDETGTGSSGLSVFGNVRVQSGATAILGCEAAHFACVDDPHPEAPTLSSEDRISGNLQEQQPLGVVVHDTTIGGNVAEQGGGGGFTCEPSGVFALFHSPVYSDYEDTVVAGNLDVNGLTSCWLGVARVQVGGNLRMLGNQLADPDAIEIVANQIQGNLMCLANSQVWDSSEVGKGLFPRTPGPNTVLGKRLGQCVLASPTTEGGPLGPGPF
jgi:hypothetical protein